MNYLYFLPVIIMWVGTTIYAIIDHFRGGSSGAMWFVFNYVVVLLFSGIYGAVWLDKML